MTVKPGPRKQTASLCLTTITLTQQGGPGVEGLKEKTIFSLLESKMCLGEDLRDHLVQAPCYTHEKSDLGVKPGLLRFFPPGYVLLLNLLHLMNAFFSKVPPTQNQGQTNYFSTH